jgi:hypothetical protein
VVIDYLNDIKMGTNRLAVKLGSKIDQVFIDLLLNSENSSHTIERESQSNKTSPQDSHDPNDVDKAAKAEELEVAEVAEDQASESSSLPVIISRKVASQQRATIPYMQQARYAPYLGFQPHMTMRRSFPRPYFSMRPVYYPHPNILPPYGGYAPMPSVPNPYIMPHPSPMMPRYPLNPRYSRIPRPYDTVAPIVNPDVQQNIQSEKEFLGHKEEPKKE